ncbi:MAG: transposase family protein, partial [Methylocella sp.]
RTLWDALGEIEDRRGRQGRNSELRSILGVALAAMLAGSNDLLSIFRWGRRLKPEALKLFLDCERARALSRDLSLFLSRAQRRRAVPRHGPFCARRR